MNRKLTWLVLAMTLTTLPVAVLAETSTVSQETLNQIHALQEQIKSLQMQLSTLKQQSGMMEGERKMMRLSKKLIKGESNEEVKKLQEVLSTDPEIYPEGLKTGYYGAFTEKAVLKFQHKAGLPETGIVDDATQAKINEFLAEWASHAKQVPPGLLRAPGIWKKMEMVGTSTAPVKPGTDRTAPVISNVAVPPTTANSATISWQTNELTIGKIHFATITPVLGSGQKDPVFDYTYATNHSLVLSNLQPNTTYYYYVKVQDQAGNSATTPDASFVTPSL